MAVAKQNPPKKRGRPSTKDTKTKTTNVNSSVEKAVCYCCGGKNQSDFYKSHNRFNKHFQVIPYCKKCMRTNMWEYFIQKYNGNEQLALHGLLRSLNLPYIHNLYLASLKNLSNPNAKINNVDNSEEDNNNVLISAYMKNYNSLYSRNGYGDTYLDSDGLGDITELSEYEDTIKIQRRRKIEAVENIEDIDREKYEVIEYDADELVYKWGDFCDADLLYLENEYLDWKDKVGDFIEEKSTELMVCQICLQTLEIYKKRQLGEKVKEEIATLQALLNNSGLLDKQKVNANAKKGLGVTIRELEEYAPIKPVETALDDVDGYREMILSIAGCLFKAQGVENEYTEITDRILAPYDLDIVNSLKNYDLEEAVKDG